MMNQKAWVAPLTYAATIVFFATLYGLISEFRHISIYVLEGNKWLPAGRGWSLLLAGWPLVVSGGLLGGGLALLAAAGVYEATRGEIYRRRLAESQQKLATARAVALQEAANRYAHAQRQAQDARAVADAETMEAQREKVKARAEIEAAKTREQSAVERAQELERKMRNAQGGFQRLKASSTSGRTGNPNPKKW